MRTRSIFMAALFTVTPVAAHAGDADEFAGLTVGVGAGVVQHHFSLVVNGRDREIKGTGFGGAAMIGYSIPVASHILVGAEGGLHFGGKKADTRIALFQNQNDLIGIDPRYGWSAVARLGYVVSRKVMLFGSGGYGEHRYTAFAPSPQITPTGTVRSRITNSSFVLGGGAEYRIGSKVSLRADLRHLDGSRNEILLGVQTRF